MTLSQLVPKTRSWTKFTFKNSKFIPSSSTTIQTKKTSFLSKSVLLTLSNSFLPTGYPKTVSKEYWNYSKWQFLHSVTGTVTGTLSLQALLQALGLSSTIAIGFSATTNWIIKDGFGLLGGVLFAGVVNNKFDSHPKKYRFMAGVLIQISSFIELLTPLFPALFLPMASLSNIGKNIGWLATSATRASMNRGLTMQDNLGDVTAKSGAQSTAAGLAGTGIGIILSYLTGSEFSMLVCCFIPLTALNLYSAYKTNTSIVTRTFNIERAEMALKPVCDHLIFNHCYQKTTNDTDILSLKEKEDFKNLIMRPETVSKTESFFFKQPKIFTLPLQIEPNIQSITTGTTNLDFLKGSSIPSHNGVQGYRVLHDAGSIKLWFLEDADHVEFLRGFYHGCLLRVVFERDGCLTLEGERECGRVVSESFKEVFKGVERCGWDVLLNHLGDQNKRIRIEED